MGASLQKEPAMRVPSPKEAPSIFFSQEGSSFLLPTFIDRICAGELNSLRLKPDQCKFTLVLTDIIDLLRCPRLIAERVVHHLDSPEVRPKLRINTRLR